MTKLAARLLVASTLVVPAIAAITCATGYDAKTGVENSYCMGDSTSCMTDSTCCTAQPTCASQTSLACDAGTYNKNDATLAGSDAKASCCVAQKCSEGTCPAGYEKDSTKANNDCPAFMGGINCNDKSCCKVITDSCQDWHLNDGGTPNACPTGKVLLPSRMDGDAASCCGDSCTGYSCPSGQRLSTVHPVTAKVSGQEAASCCIEVTKTCANHTCPSTTHQAKAASPETITCGRYTNAAEGGQIWTNVCTNALCCDCKSTLCCGKTVTCGTNEYQDTAKGMVVFTNEVADCCTSKAQCKDTVTTTPAPSQPSTSDSVATAPAFLVMMAIIYAAGK